MIRNVLHKVSQYLALKLALIVFVCVGLLSLCMGMWQVQKHAAEQDGMLQWQSLHLARYIADRQDKPFIGADGVADTAQLNQIAMYINLIHPSLEAYLISPNGKVLAHTLGEGVSTANKVDITPVLQLRKAERVSLPVYADDPRVPEQKNIVSVAALPTDTNVKGYLYVVLKGQAAQAVSDKGNANRQKLVVFLTTLLAGLLAAIVIVVAQWGVVARLKQLTQKLQNFRQPDGFKLLPHGARGDDLGQVIMAAAALQQRVVSQFDTIAANQQQRRELISNISHDLHTPLANIQVYVETLSLKYINDLPEHTKPYVHSLLQNCKTLHKRIQDLFELAQLEGNTADVRMERFSIAELLNDVVVSYSPLATERNITIAYQPQAQAQADLCVVADIALIERVLQNLIDNAIFYSPANSTIHCAITQHSNKVTVTISDSGKGIAEADLTHIFERSWSTARHSAQKSALKANAGLGLAIVKRILDLHQSAIEVESELNVGSTFRFSLLNRA